MDSHTFERDGKVFFVSPVTPITLNADEEIAFDEQIRKLAPNENLLWLRGRYVEADRPNRNKQQWRAGDIALKYLQPVFMPVTVMHDYRTAVGLIADTKLLTPENSDAKRARIDTTLGVWAHRFPQIADEIQHNYEAGTLMSSMEATSPFYECSVCGELFHKLPGGAERSKWCEHLAQELPEAARILGGVTFTGTGLIFGSRGAEGAYDEAHLDVFEEAVAEYHEKAHKDTDTGKRKKMDEITLSKKEYTELSNRPTQEALDAEKSRADEAESKLAETQTKLEEAEATANTKGEELEAANKKLQDKEEAEQKAELRDGRIDKLGEGFLSKLPESAKSRIKDQAGEMEDDEWSARIDELSELVGVKPEDATVDEPNDEFSAEEIARSKLGGGEKKTEQTDANRRSVVGKLMGGN